MILIIKYLITKNCIRSEMILDAKYKFISQKKNFITYFTNNKKENVIKNSNFTVLRVIQSSLLKI